MLPARKVRAGSLEKEKAMLEDTIRFIEENRLIAIVRGIAPEKCLKVADALYEGGFRLVEVTFNQKEPDSFRTTADAIAVIAEKYKDRMMVGAGTVVSPELVEQAAAAGARFIISPDVNVDVIRRTRELGLASFPGAMTPTEIMTAHRAGASFVKLFPIADLGSKYVKAVRAPISHVKLLAVGGVNENNLKEFFAAGCVGAGIGGNLVNKAWIDAGEYSKITETARMLVEIAKES